MPLSDAACRNAKPREKPFKIFDGGGLHLLVNPNGSKLWRLATPLNGKGILMSFGRYPEVPLADARAQAFAAKEAIAKGIDPRRLGAGESRIVSRHDPLSFQALAIEWHALQCPGWVDAHAERVLSRFKRDVFPEIGERRIDSIEPPDVLEVIRKVEARGALDVSRRLRQQIGAVFRFAIAKGVATRDPSADITAALASRPRVRHHAKLKAAEIQDFYKRLIEYDGDRQTRLAIEFIMHTFVRTSELRFATLAEFDTKADHPVWRIPPERMKRPFEHVVPLTPQSLEIFEELKTLAGKSPLLLPGKTPEKPISANTMIFALYRMGYHSRLTMHGFRGTASTILNESGRFDPDWIERQLAHVEENKIRGAYNAAQWLTQRTDMMRWWSNYLSREKQLATMLS